MPLTPAQQQAVEKVFLRLLKKTFKKLQDTNLDAQPINPFLATLIARSPEDLAEFIVWQRLERGIVTSMGNALQKIALEVGSVMHGSGVSEADLEGRNDLLKRHFLMQVKSGPDTVNKGMATNISRELSEAEHRMKLGGAMKGWVVVKMLGMCYGRPAQRNSWAMGLARSGFDIDKIGREFWAFITGHAGTYEEVFQLAQAVASSHKNSVGKTLPQLIQDTINALAKQIDERYGDGVGGIEWAKLLEDNM